MISSDLYFFAFRTAFGWGEQVHETKFHTNKERACEFGYKPSLLADNVGGKRSFSANLKIEMTEKFGQNPARIFLLTFVRRG